jgi:hypothetical protein
MEGGYFENEDLIPVVNVQPTEEPHELIQQVPQQTTEMLTKRGLPMRRSARGVSARVASILNWEQASENSKTVQDVADAFENEFQYEVDNKKRRMTYQAPDSDSEVELGDTDDDEDQSSIIDSSSEDGDFAEPNRETESESEKYDYNSSESSSSSETIDQHVDNVDSPFEGMVEYSVLQHEDSHSESVELRTDDYQAEMTDSQIDITELCSDKDSEIEDITEIHSEPSSRFEDSFLLSDTEQIQVDHFFTE